MKITVKFFSSLMEYLPDGADDNAIELNESAPLSPNAVLEKFDVPRAEVRTMMRNGIFLPEEERDAALADGDTLTVWPSIQGG